LRGITITSERVRSFDASIFLKSLPKSKPEIDFQHPPPKEGVEYLDAKERIALPARRVYKLHGFD
jgi:hypothetical protein